MAPILRKLGMGKRREKDADRVQDSQTSTASSSQSTIGITDVPPPSEDQVQANNNSSSRRFSPSKNLLDRYKRRSLNVKASPPMMASPTRDSGSGNDARTSVFTESFDGQDDVAPDQNPQAAAAAENLPPQSSASSRYEITGYERDDENGTQFEMLKPVTRASRRRSSATSTTNRGCETSQDRAVGVKPRITRSSSRRHERVDSHQDTTVITKDFADQLQTTTLTDSVEALNINKGKNNNDGPEETALAAPPPLLSKKKEKRPSIDEPRGPRDLPVPPIPAQLKTSSQSLFRHNASPPPPVAVRVPIFNANKTPAQQWESDHTNTSRPDKAWGWAKRWICCQCGAQTIVESTRCAALVCGHGRCENGCRLQQTPMLTKSKFA